MSNWENRYERRRHEELQNQAAYRWYLNPVGSFPLLPEPPRLRKPIKNTFFLQGSLRETSTILQNQIPNLQKVTNENDVTIKRCVTSIFETYFEPKDYIMEKYLEVVPNHIKEKVKKMSNEEKAQRIYTGLGKFKGLNNFRRIRPSTCYPDDDSTDITDATDLLDLIKPTETNTVPVRRMYLNKKSTSTKSFHFDSVLFGLYSSHCLSQGRSLKDNQIPTSMYRMFFPMVHRYDLQISIYEITKVIKASMDKLKEPICFNVAAARDILQYPQAVSTDEDEDNNTTPQYTYFNSTEKTESDNLEVTDYYDDDSWSFSDTRFHQQNNYSDNQAENENDERRAVMETSNAKSRRIRKRRKDVVVTEYSDDNWRFNMPELPGSRNQDENNRLRMEAPHQPFNELEPTAISKIDRSKVVRLGDCDLRFSTVIKDIAMAHPVLKEQHIQLIVESYNDRIMTQALANKFLADEESGYKITIQTIMKKIFKEISEKKHVVFERLCKCKNRFIRNETDELCKSCLNPYYDLYRGQSNDEISDVSTDDLYTLDEQ
ncbi:hypothetical protein DAMA08_007610 [Martiniozyma asiatica (nom. inval.)]|nr:hypothetical protein DAMA08_007610 [Martiniozyma asiatica]